MKTSERGAVNARTASVFEFADFRLDAAKRLLTRRDGTPVPLTPRVFDTLLYMVEHSGEVLGRERLMDAVWPDAIVEENNLTQNISTLRRVLGDERGSNRFIVTLPGRGYRFVAEVRNTEQPAAMEPARPRAGGEPAPPARPARGRAGSIAVAFTVILLGTAALLWWLRGEARGPVAGVVSNKSIAVLPFENLSGDPENAYFADGIKDEILTRLSKVAALKVISRTSTQQFKSAPHNLREIARQLGVANILEGSVQKSGDNVRVTVQLIHAQSDTHLWAETYDRKLADMFQVETEVAQRIAAALEATLTGAERRALDAKPTANVHAYQAYLKGRFFWNKRTPEGYRRALEHFNQALALDPGYAQAYAGLADAYLFLVSDSVSGQQELLDKGRAALHRALELDETLAEAHASLGLNAVNFDWEWTRAEQEFRRAIELNPNYATAHQWYGEFLASMGRADEGIRTIKRAQELDPLSLVINTDVAKVYLLSRRYDDAIAQFKHAQEMDPGFDVAHGLLGLTYSLKGEHEAAVAEFRQMKDFSQNPLFLCWLGNVYGAAGRKEEAGKIVDQLRELSNRTDVSPICFALVYAGMGEEEEAFRWLEKVIAERAPWGAIAIKGSPHFDGLRSDPRYAALLRRANLAP